MDTTKQYIKMCEKAQEIQESKVFHHLGDFIYINEYIRIINGYSLSEGGNKYRAIHNVDDNFIERWYMEVDDFSIWLPRQDQLQDMIEGNLMDKLNNFNKFIYPPILNIRSNISKERLEIFREKWEKTMKEAGRIVAIPVCKDEKSDLINVFTSTFTSFEQLWLAFVMKEKYNKIWNQETENWELINN